jgi:hypothetical protein
MTSGKELQEFACDAERVHHDCQVRRPHQQPKQTNEDISPVCIRNNVSAISAVQTRRMVWLTKTQQVAYERRCFAWE